MTVARRIAPIIEVTPQGRQVRAFRRGGMDVDHIESAARYLASEGADEIWVHLLEPDDRGAGGLYDAVKALRPQGFLPLVAWGAVRTASDARLLVGLGADRVVVDCSDDDVGDPAARIALFAQAVGPDRVAAAIEVRRVARQDSSAWEYCRHENGGTGQDARSVLGDLFKAGAGELVVMPWSGSNVKSHATGLVEILSAAVSNQVVSIGTESGPADLAAPLLLGADAVASADLFVSGEQTVAQVKATLQEYGVTLRPAEPPYTDPR